MTQNKTLCKVPQSFYPINRVFVVTIEDRDHRRVAIGYYTTINDPGDEVDSAPSNPDPHADGIQRSLDAQREP